jgi:uncharacterized membrane protein
MEAAQTTEPLAADRALQATRRIPRRRAALVLGALLFASAVCILIVLLRRAYLGYASYSFLIWNLTLAWIPLLFSFATYRFHLVGRHKTWLFAVCAIAWFLFFPNAPYMVTDFVHLSPIHIAPEWLDVITIVACAWTGWSIGFLSLYLMQEIVRVRWGWISSWLFALAMLALGSVGVFCGRYLRWNSWDVIRDPLHVLRLRAYIQHQYWQPGDLMFLLTLALFLLLSYVALYALTHLYDRG